MVLCVVMFSKLPEIKAEKKEVNYNMGYQKEKHLEETIIVKETEVTLSNYERGKKKYTDEEQKKIDDVISCQIEDAKIRRDEGK